MQNFGLVLKMRRKVCIFLIMVLLLSCCSCGFGKANPDRNNYIFNDYSALVVNGEKYVAIDIDSYGIGLVSHTQPIGEFKMQYRGLFDDTYKPYGVKAEIPLIYASFMIKDYYCPESQYDECIQYLENLCWDEKIVLDQDKNAVFSDELTHYILQEASIPKDVESIKYKSESNHLKYYGVVQLDTTGTFYRDVGDILIRSRGDAYFLPLGYDYSSALDFRPTGAEYDAISQALASQRIPDEYVLELLNTDFG